MKREEWVAPIPGRPCLTGLLGGCQQCTKEREIGENVLRDGELSQVVANHLRLDLNLVELLAGVDTDDGTDHLGDNDHVTEVGLNEVGLLVGLGLLLGLAELLDQTHGLALETAVEASAGTSVDNIAELLGGEVEEPRVFSQIQVRGKIFHCQVPSQHRAWHNCDPKLMTTVKTVSKTALASHGHRA